MTSVIYIMITLQIGSAKREHAYNVDSADPRTSNWLRYVNCARHPRELNLEMLPCYGKVFFMTRREVKKGEELLLYYGDSYALELGIDPGLFRT